MKLRSGKTTGSTETTPATTLDVELAEAKAVLIKKIQDCLASLALVSAENTPHRIQVCYNVFRIISDNLEFISTTEFSPSPKFITVVYDKTYELADELFPSLEKYITENRPTNGEMLYKIADETYFLILKVRQDIEKHRPELKPKYNNNDYWYTGCDCNSCLEY